jgi:NAD(P)H-binding
MTLRTEQQQIRLLTAASNFHSSLPGRLHFVSSRSVDVFQGNLSQPATLFDAMDGAVGVVIAAAPEWWRPDGSEAVEGLGTVAAIEAATKAKTVQRIVLLAPAVGTSARAAHRVEAEEALKASGIPFVIVRIPSLSNKQGGMSNIILRQESKKSSVAPGKSLTRVDAAQIVCQALVHDRFIQEMAESDPEGGFAFGSCVVEASNGDDPSIIDQRYWREQFAALDGE